MPQSIPQSSAASLDESMDAAQLEGLWSVTLRRARYVLAVLLCGVFYWYAAWALVAPPPQYAGISLLVWPGVNPLLAILGLAAVVSIGTALAMLVTHPDAPYTGMFCALLGLGGLAVRGGPIHLMILNAETHAAGRALFVTLAWESLLWLVVLAAAEFTTRLCFRSVFRQSQWLLRQGAEPPMFGRLVPLSWMASEGAVPPRDRLAWLADLGAFGITFGLGIMLLVITLHAQSKGQVLFGCFASFALAAMAANGTFPRSRVAAIYLAVPAAALLGYYRAASTYMPPSPIVPGVYPGHAAVNMARALPIDYIVAGVPGAIAGVHMTISLRIHNMIAAESPASAA